MVTCNNALGHEKSGSSYRQNFSKGNTGNNRFLSQLIKINNTYANFCHHNSFRSITSLAAPDRVCGNNLRQKVLGMVYCRITISFYITGDT